MKKNDCLKCPFMLREEQKREQTELEEFILSIEKRVGYWGSLMNQTKTLDPTEKILWNLKVAHDLDPPLFSDMRKFVYDQRDWLKEKIKKADEHLTNIWDLRIKEYETAIRAIEKITGIREGS